MQGIGKREGAIWDREREMGFFLLPLIIMIEVIWQRPIDEPEVPSAHTLSPFSHCSDPYLHLFFSLPVYISFCSGKLLSRTQITLHPLRFRSSHEDNSSSPISFQCHWSFPSASSVTLPLPPPIKSERFQFSICPSQFFLLPWWCSEQKSPWIFLTPFLV